MVVGWQSSTFEELLTYAALLAMAVGMVWFVVVVSAVGAEAVTRGRFRMAHAAGCPRWLHRWLLVALSALLGAAVLAPAPGSAHPQRAGVLDGLALPDRPTGPPIPRETTTPTRHHQPLQVSSVVTVQSGQTLWEISKHQLRRGSGSARIAAFSRSLHAQNRAVIGADPDLIHPGQALSIPGTTRETYSEDS